MTRFVVDIYIASSNDVACISYFVDHLPTCDRKQPTYTLLCKLAVVKHSRAFLLCTLYAGSHTPSFSSIFTKQAMGRRACLQSY